jgi:hypothetical protein
MAQYKAPDPLLLYLIRQTIEGPAERRLAAKFLLECLRTSETPEDIAQFIENLEHRSILAIADETRRLAADLRLVR